jgi:hypothetical protein
MPPLLSDACWAKLVGPIRRYAASSGPAADREQDFRQQVTKLVMLFRDSRGGRRPRGWMSDFTDLWNAIALHPLDGRLAAALSAGRPYYESARRADAPLPGRARERLRQVEKRAAALRKAIIAALHDPWLDGAWDTEMTNPSTMSALLVRNVMAPETWTFLLRELTRGLNSVSEIGDAAKRSIEWFKVVQVKGRPPADALRLPAALLCALAKQYAPAPARRQGVERWRDDLAEFVGAVLRETGLPAVDREFLVKNLLA